MSHGGTAAWGRGHAVNFYALDSECIDAVADYVAAGWGQHDAAVVLATTSHLVAIDAALTARGLDVAARRADGSYLTNDADALIERFTVDGRFDSAGFLRVAAEMIDEASSGGVQVRAYGELVARMWDCGDVEGALELELAWNEVLRGRDFSLLCAYPIGVFDGAALVDVQRMCDLHTDVEESHSEGPGSVSTTALGRGHACSRVYLPVPESVPAARHFVADVLRLWDLHVILGDAALVVSELATNALSHADSPFRTVVDRAAGRVRIGVEDTLAVPLERRTPADEDVDGRGVGIIEALSMRWGIETLPGGKVVWAELADGETRSSAR